MRKLPVLVASAAIASCYIATTHAESTGSRRSETVQFADLDLKNKEGAITLYRRLHNAAADVCFQPFDGADYVSAPLYKSCVNRAMSEAVSAVGQPVVTAYAQAQGVPVAFAADPVRN